MPMKWVITSIWWSSAQILIQLICLWVLFIHATSPISVRLNVLEETIMGN